MRGRNTVARKELALKQHKKSASRSDHFSYFLLHNILSFLLFFWIAISLNLFEQRVQNASDIFTNYYIEYLGTLIAIMFVTGFSARFLTYYGIFYPIYKYSRMYENRHLASFMDLNFRVGFNRISLSYFAMIIINAFLFSVGAIAIVQATIFKEDATLLTLMIAYIVIKSIAIAIVKFGRYTFTKIITGMKV